MTRVTVEEALQKARMTINLPATCILLGCLGQALMVVPSGTAPLPILYVSGMLGALCWPLSWQMTEAAIAAKVIAPDGSLFERTEICSPATRAEIRRLEGRA